MQNYTTAQNGHGMAISIWTSEYYKPYVLTGYVMGNYGD